MEPHPYVSLDHCPTCALWAHHLAEAMRDEPARDDLDDTPPKAFVTCRHLGALLQRSTIAQFDLNPFRFWRECEMGHGQPPGMICPCESCGPKCPDFTPEDLRET